MGFVPSFDNFTILDASLFPPSASRRQGRIPSFFRKSALAFVLQENHLPQDNCSKSFACRQQLLLMNQPHEAHCNRWRTTPNESFSEQHFREPGAPFPQATTKDSEGTSSTVDKEPLTSSSTCVRGCLEQRSVSINEATVTPAHRLLITSGA